MSDSTPIIVPHPAAIIAPTPERTLPSASNALVHPGRSSAAWIAVAFVLSRYAGAVVANHSACGRLPSGAARSARRAASTPIDVVSSSYDATLLVPRPPPLPSVWVIALRCRRQY